jgi:hypothetical protein
MVVKIREKKGYKKKKKEKEREIGFQTIVWIYLWSVSTYFSSNTN